MDFTVQEEGKLIKMVQTNTELFDFLHEKYKDPVHRDNVWADIAKTIGKSGMYYYSYGYFTNRL